MTWWIVNSVVCLADLLHLTDPMIDNYYNKNNNNNYYCYC